MCRMDRSFLRVVAGASAFLSFAGFEAACAAQETKPSAAVVISLSEAIHRAQQNEPVFASALAAQKSASIDRYLAKAALLPFGHVSQPDALHAAERTDESNASAWGTGIAGIYRQQCGSRVHSQASINETVGLKQFADAQVASANAARASAELEVARRGLVSSVVNLYYSVAASETKKRVLEEAFQEAQSFTDLTQKRETAREVAHADVVKAQLLQQQRQRDLSDGTLAADKARLELAVLLFPDPRTPYSTESCGSRSALPTRDEVDRLAATKNPEIRSALAELRAGNAEVTAARAAYLPDLAFELQLRHRCAAVRQSAGRMTCTIWDIQSARRSTFRCGTGSPRRSASSKARSGAMPPKSR